MNQPPLPTDIHEAFQRCCLPKEFSERDLAIRIFVWRAVKVHQAPENSWAIQFANLVAFFRNDEPTEEKRLEAYLSSTQARINAAILLGDKAFLKRLLKAADLYLEFPPSLNTSPESCAIWAFFSLQEDLGRWPTKAEVRGCVKGHGFPSITDRQWPRIFKIAGLSELSKGKRCKRTELVPAENQVEKLNPSDLVFFKGFSKWLATPAPRPEPMSAAARLVRKSQTDI
jgi:hypothetical protein